jgi:hypothetical protein
MGHDGDNTLTFQENRDELRALPRNPVESELFTTAEQTLQGYEVMHIIRHGQLQGSDRGDVLSQHTVIAELFGVAV